MPRTSSTSLMYSFGQREDMHVFDEPLYASFLASNPDIRRPYREELLREGEPDLQKAIDDTLLGDEIQTSCAPERGGPHRFFKNIANQLQPEHPGVQQIIANPNVRNVFLVRNPAKVLSSYWAVVGGDNFGGLEQEASTMMGLQQLAQLRELLIEQGTPPIVIENEDLLEAPEGTLRALCDRLELPFDPAMLSWSKGGMPNEGLWARYWYHISHASTGFAPVSPMAATGPSLPSALQAQLDETAAPLYAALRDPMSPTRPLRPKPLLPDSRNADIWVSVGGKLLPRDEAKVSVFDSAVQAGDQVWEGLRVKDGAIFAMEEHLARMQDSAKALHFKRVPTNEEIKQAVWDTLRANGMRDGAHIRLTLTRGDKVTSGMSPRNNQGEPCLIVLAEWKKETDSVPGSEAGLRLISSAIRRNTPSCLDSKIHHGNLLNNILAKIQSDEAGVDDAIMLDMDGFVAETNAMNIFIVKDGVLKTPFGDACLPGITRTIVHERVAPRAGVPSIEARLSLSEVWSADEVFTTGTMGGLAPVVEIDGRRIGKGLSGAAGPVTQKLLKAYQELQREAAVPIPE